MAIACLRRGRLEHAVILDPIRQEEFVASRGHGAQLNGRRIRVSNRPKLAGAIIAAGGPNMNEVATQQGRLYEYLMKHNCVIRQTGSACLDLAYLAGGRLDGLWLRGLHVWDLAAGALLVTEAGGLVGDFEGGSKFLESGNIVAATPKCFRELLPLVSKYTGDQ